MGVINFDQVFNELKTGVETIAETSLQGYEKEAKSDGQQALNDVKSNLLQWTKELETGSITKEDVGDLLQEEEALDKMVALKQAGLAAIHVDRFKNDIINLVVTTITGLV